MTINDLWHEVEVDSEVAALDRAKREARKAIAPKVSFLMEASTREAFEDRLALIDGDIDRIVHETAGIGAAYALARASVVEDLDAMFVRGEARRRREAAARRARHAKEIGPVVDERVLVARRAAHQAHEAKSTEGSVKKAATQAEVDAWLERMDPKFAEWAKPYAQRMVYGPTYNRSIANNLPEAARAYKAGGFEDRQFRYVRSQLDAALGSERGEEWYWDEAQGEYTQRLQGTMAAKQADIKPQGRLCPECRNESIEMDPPYAECYECGWQGRADELVNDKESRKQAESMDLLWKSIDGITTTEVGKIAMTAVADSIGVAWAITSKDGEVEYATGKSRTIESAKEAMERHADIFGQDPDVAAGTNPPKKKVKKKKVVSDTEEVVEDPDVEDEVEDEEDEDVIEDDAEDELPEVTDPDDQVESVDPMTLDVGDTLTVSYTMGTGETGEVEGVFVRLEEDIAFFSGPNGEFGVAERDGVWIDSEGNQFTFSFGSPDVTGEIDPNADFVDKDNPATPAEDPPVADAEDEGDTEYKVDDDSPKKKKKNQPPWLKGKGTLSTTTPMSMATPMSMYPNTSGSAATTTVAYISTPASSIRSMAELVTAIGDLQPGLEPEEVFELAKQAMAASKERAAR